MAGRLWITPGLSFGDHYTEADDKLVRTMGYGTSVSYAWPETFISYFSFGTHFYPLIDESQFLIAIGFF